MCAVPRIFEKVRVKILEDIREMPGIAGRIARWAVSQEARSTKAELQGGKPGPVWTIAQKLMFAKLHQKVQARFGGRVAFFHLSRGAVAARHRVFFQSRWNHDLRGVRLD